MTGWPLALAPQETSRMVNEATASYRGSEVFRVLTASGSSGAYDFYTAP
jgi:hypothetical protein